MTAPEKTQGEMKNPNDMTLDECRDELARNAGWTLNTSYRCPVWERGIESTVACPIPATLDEAAKLRGGWSWTLVHYEDYEVWKAWSLSNSVVEIVRTDDEQLDRFRLRVAVERLARQGEGGGQ